MDGERGEIARGLGRVEGRVQGIDERVGRLEDSVQKGFEAMRKQLAELAASDNRRKGALVVLSGIISAAVTYAVEKVMR